MTTQDVFVAIAKAALGQDAPTEEVVLASMIVLHTCDFVLNDDCILDDVVWPAAKQGKILESVTQRHAAEVIASATGHESDQAVINKWYATYVSRTPYELLEIVPEPLMSRVRQCISRVLKHPLIADVVESK
jgi:hypothetical protein